MEEDSGQQEDLQDERPAADVEVGPNILGFLFFFICQNCFRHVWPWAHNDSLAHDSYHCRKWAPFSDWAPFPTQRENSVNNFVGAIGNMKIWKECPAECRPREHQDWTRC